MRALSKLSALSATVSALLLSDPGARAESVNLWTGEGVTVGRILKPQLSITTAVGGSTAPDGALAVGHHDPDRDGITVQNAELALSAQLAKNITASALYAAKVNLDNHWEDLFEEYYFAITELPGDAKIKGGRFYTQFGFQNPLHPHDFTFVDQNLINGRLVDEDSATVYGGEVTLPVARHLPTGWSDRLSLSFGAVPDAHAAHYHGPETEAEFEGELAAFNDLLGTAEYRLIYEASATTKYQFGISGAWGKNQFQRQTHVYGLHFERLWKAPAPACDHKEHLAHDHHHHSETGEFVRWRTEAMLRRFGAVSSSHEEHDDHEEHDEHDTHEEHEESEEPTSLRRKSFTDAGFYTALTYGFPGGRWQAHLRGEYLSGVDEAGLDERWRVSPAVSWFPRHDSPVFFKLQYNYDHTRSLGEEHSVWLQINFNWGEETGHEH